MVDWGWTITSTFRGRHVKESARLDDLKPFVHQGGRVDGDAPPHLPGGMIQRLLHRDRRKLGRREYCGMARRKPSARCGRLRPCARRACTGARRCARCRWAASGLPWRRASAVMSSPAATRHSLLANPTVFPGAHRFVSRFEPSHADNRADHEIDFRMRGDAHGSGSAVHDFDLHPALLFSVERVECRHLSPRPWRSRAAASGTPARTPRRDCYPAASVTI